MSGVFADATVVQQMSAARFGGEIRDGWDVAGNAHGGYLLSIAGRAMSIATERPDPVTVTAHYLRAARPGPITVDTEVLRTGRRFSTARAMVSSPERDLVAVLATFGDLADDGTEHPELIDAEPPELPDPEQCERVVPAVPFPPAFTGHLDLRLHPDDGRFLGGERSGMPRIRGWLRLPDDEPVDTIAMLTMVDAFPPTVFNVDLPIAWVPTLELTTHLRARPTPGWLACEVSTRFVSGGFLEVDGVYWDRAGKLVAQSRQLALVPRSAPDPAE